MDQSYALRAHHSRAIVYNNSGKTVAPRLQHKMIHPRAKANNSHSKPMNSHIQDTRMSNFSDKTIDNDIISGLTLQRKKEDGVNVKFKPFPPCGLKALQVSGIDTEHYIPLNFSSRQLVLGK